MSEKGTVPKRTNGPKRIAAHAYVILLGTGRAIHIVYDSFVSLEMAEGILPTLNRVHRSPLITKGMMSCIP